MSESLPEPIAETVPYNIPKLPATVVAARLAPFSIPLAACDNAD